MNKIMGLARSLFGGAASEGPAYFVAGNADYGLYIHFGLLGKKSLPMGAKLVPLWQIVFNGIILSNPATECTNYTIKDPYTRLETRRVRGKADVLSLFGIQGQRRQLDGNSDLVCGDAAAAARSVEAIKRGYVEFSKLSRLQKVFMDSHSEIGEGVFLTKYADGTEVVCNYSPEVFMYKGKGDFSVGYAVLSC